MAVSIKSILNTLNTHNYSDLSVFLQDTDWSGLTPATIVPKKEMRKFVKAIEDREVRLAVMKFLYDYTDAYFFEGAEALAIDEYHLRGIGATNDVIRLEASHKIRSLKDELDAQIKQVKSLGEYSGDKISKLQKQNEQLEKQVKDLKEQISKLEDELDFLKNPHAYGKQVPVELHNTTFHYIMEYLISYNLAKAYTKPTAYGISISCYQWYGSKALFGFLVDKISFELELRDSGGRLNWKPFKHAFLNFDDLIDEARNAVTRYTNKKEAKWPEKAEIIDEAIKYAREKEEKLKPRK